MTDAPDMASPDFIRTFPNRTSDFIAQQAADLTAMTAERDALVEALRLSDAVFSGANMNMRVVEKKVRAALALIDKGDPA